jgi:hypothetical protein
VCDEELERADAIASLLAEREQRTVGEWLADAVLPNLCAIDGAVDLILIRDAELTHG